MAVGTYFFLALLSSLFAINTAFTTSSFLSQLLKQQNSVSIFSKKSPIFVQSSFQLQGKRVTSDNEGDEKVKKVKNRKRWAVYELPIDGSRPG
jgi:hypothetical protein